MPASAGFFLPRIYRVRAVNHHGYLPPGPESGLAHGVTFRIIPLITLTVATNHPSNTFGGFMSLQELNNIPGVTATPDSATQNFVFNHTMLRVKHIEKSLDFYTRVLGFSLVEKRDFPEAAFSLYFLALVDKAQIPADDAARTVWMKSIPGIIDLVKTLRDEGLTIVLIEHNMKVISELADEAVFMNRGARMVSGTPHEVATDPGVVELYLGEAKDGH